MAIAGLCGAIVGAVSHNTMKNPAIAAALPTIPVIHRRTDLAALSFDRCGFFNVG
ncbi:MAG TPA: hypothetical protein VKP67_17050 [Xanthobacteraceae bacterium]|nr:hypothetical protein [Xanthobacteraceae bacterium]